MMADTPRTRGASLALQDVAARAGGFQLGPLCLAVPAGAYGCVLGPAGAGKTLLLRAVAGLARCTGRIERGRIERGRIERGSVGKPAGVALLAADGGISAHGSVAGAIAFRLGVAGVARGRLPERLAALLEEFALDGAAAPDRLSPDAVLRARLAAALAGQPALLLLDDVLAACDDRLALIQTLRTAQRRRGTTVLHVLRRPQDALALADHLALLQAGLILQAGSAAALYERPATLAIARTLGPANILPGRIEQIENDVAYVRLECGPLIEADPPEDPQIVPPEGLPCQVLLRPERVAVSTVPAAELGGSAIAAVLRDVTHLGDTLRLSLSIGTDAEIVVARPAALGTPGLVPGRTVSVAWQSRHVLTFPG